MKRRGFVLALLLAACGNAAPQRADDAAATKVGAPVQAAAGAPADAFPRPARPVAVIVSDQWSDEDTRDEANEAVRVMDLLGVRAGQSVADVGAGTGYYTVRLARRVGPEGRVYAEDIVPEFLRRLTGRVEAARLTQVIPVLGQAHDPRLPPRSIDTAFLVHMYHEIEQPYGLLWNLRSSLKPGAKVAIVDADRPTNRHGTPPKLLACELAAVGFDQVAFHPLKGAGGYLAIFEPRRPRPEPRAVRACID